MFPEIQAIRATSRCRGTTGRGRYPLGGHFVSWEDLYAILQRLTGRNILTVPMPSFAARTVGPMLDALKPVVAIEP